MNFMVCPLICCVCLWLWLVIATRIHPSVCAILACQEASEVIPDHLPGMITRRSCSSLGFQHAEHIRITLVDEYLMLVGHFPAYVAWVNIRDFVLLDVTVDGLVGVHLSVAYLRDRTNTEFQRVIVTRDKIKRALFAFRLVNQTASITDYGHGRVVRMSGDTKLASSPNGATWHDLRCNRMCPSWIPMCRFSGTA